MNLKTTYVLFALLISVSTNAQYLNKNGLTKKYLYTFSFIDGTDLSTMRQTNENVMTINRLASRLIDDESSRVDDVIKFGISFLGEIITHEEGHRSVLTNLEIGSISQPFSIFKGVAYVKGVTDETLINIRNNDFPDPFIGYNNN